MLRPFADPRVGGVTPRQAIFDVGRRPGAPARRLDRGPALPADRPGAVGVRPGRAASRAARSPTGARRSSPPSTALVRQTVLGRAAARRRRPRAHQRAAAHRLADRLPVDRARVRPTRPPDWRTFWRQQLRWGRSSQRETLLSLRWLWRRPVAFATFATDIVTPFALYAVVALGVAHAARGDGRPRRLAARRRARARLRRDAGEHRPAPDPALPARARATSLRLPLFVLQLTFVMVPIRILAFATMLHQSLVDAPTSPRAVRGAQ